MHSKVIQEECMHEPVILISVRGWRRAHLTMITSSIGTFEALRGMTLIEQSGSFPCRVKYRSTNLKSPMCEKYDLLKQGG